MTDAETTPHVNFFEPDAGTGTFTRVFAELVSLAPHELVVRVNSEEYVIPSDYDLTEMHDGPVLWAYADYRGGEKSERHPHKELFPLPRTPRYDPGQSRPVYRQVTQAERDKLVWDDPAVQSALAELDDAKGTFLSLWNSLHALAADQVQFVSAVRSAGSRLPRQPNLEPEPAGDLGTPKSRARVSLLKKRKVKQIKKLFPED